MSRCLLTHASTQAPLFSLCSLSRIAVNIRPNLSIILRQLVIMAVYHYDRIPTVPWTASGRSIGRLPRNDVRTGPIQRWEVVRVAPRRRRSDAIREATPVPMLGRVDGDGPRTGALGTVWGARVGRRRGGCPETVAAQTRSAARPDTRFVYGGGRSLPIWDDRRAREHRPLPIGGWVAHAVLKVTRSRP